MNNVITIKSRTVSLTRGAKVAERLFNMLPVNELDLGLPRIVSDKETIDMNSAVLAGFLPILASNGTTTDAWLSANLIKLQVPIELRDKVAVKLNRWLINQGIVERHPTEELVVINGRLATVKHWLLTETVRRMVEETPDEAKFAPMDAPAEGELTRVKGKSELSRDVAAVLIKQDEVPLVFHDDTAMIVKHFSKKIRAEGDDPEKEIAKLAALKALSKEHAERGDKPFHLTHTTDYRGRMYARGGYISTQGDKAQKLAILFAESKHVDLEEIAIYLGRVKGCKGNNTDAALMGYGEIDNPTRIESRAILADMERAMVRIDGCSNGIQWMSAFFNDLTGMELTNLIGVEPNDLYSYVADTLGFEDRVVNGSKRENGVVKEYSKWMTARDQAKMFLMPMSYGAQPKTQADALGVDIKVVYAWIKTVSKILPIKRYLDHVQTEAEACNADKFTWTLPDGFKVVHQAHSYDSVKGGSFELKLYNTKKLDRDGMLRALAPNIIHSIDAYHARKIIATAGFPVTAIHDSFGCHSCNVPALRKIIMDTFNGILKEDVLNSIFKQLGFDLVNAPETLASNPYMFM